jgi:hypothetical protein
MNLKIKIIILLSAVLLAGTNIFAQTKNVDIDNLYFKVEYRNTPQTPLNPLFFEYSTRVIATKSTEQRVSIDEINDILGIAGQRKTDDEANAALTMVVELGDLVVESSKIEERREEKKDKNGKIINVYHYYKVSVVYRFNSLYKIFSGNKLIRSASTYDNSHQTYSTSEYSSRKDANDYWNNNKDVLISQFATTLSKQTAYFANNYASQMYGFPVIKNTDNIQITDEKKHSENEKFREACNKLKTEFELMTHKRKVNKTNVLDIIEYFKSIPAKYTDKKLKADIKLRYAAYYNLCKIYYYLDEPENIEQYANLLIANDYDKKDGEKLKKEANELKTILSRTEVDTRHFDTNEYFSE